MVVTNGSEPYLRLIEPDAILPEQTRVLFPAHLGPERRLMAAVLEEAVDCFQKHCGATSARGRRRFREAEAWLMHEPKGAPLSFETICDILGLNAGCLRRGLRLWRERQTAAPMMQAHAPDAECSLAAPEAAPPPGKRHPAQRPAARRDASDSGSRPQSCPQRPPSVSPQNRAPEAAPAR